MRVPSDKTAPRQNNVVYVAPPPEDIEKFANTFCRKLGERRGADYSDTATVQACSSFLKTVVSIKVKAMNRGADRVQEKTSTQ